MRFEWRKSEMLDGLRRRAHGSAARGAGGAALAGLALALGAHSARTAPPAILPPTDERGLPSLAPVLEKVQPAVVSISVRGKVVQQNPLLNDPFFRRFFEVPEEQQEREFQSAGSGVVIDAAKGLILTNHHVIDSAEEITVTLMGGRTLKAEVVGSDPKGDVALVRVKDSELSSIVVGNSDELRVGDFVMAIGNPFGLSQTVTSGIVSALGRSGLRIEEYEDFIQTDAAINPGNSGGALINLRGELVGINTAITSPGRAGNVGIGFAIPINMAKSIMQQLVEYGEVRRGQLGVVIQDLDPQLAKGLGFKEERGAVVTEVVTGSAAEKAGVRRDDVIVAVNGKPVSNSRQLRNEIGLIEVGKSASLDVLREGKKRTIKAVIGQGREEVHKASTDKAHPSLEGARFAESSAQRADGSAGVEVTAVEPGTPAWNLGLRPGDVVVEANRRRVEKLEQLEDAVRKRDEILLLVERRGGALYLYGD
jgi:Do/DeqQ family serine protease